MDKSENKPDKSENQGSGISESSFGDMGWARKLVELQNGERERTNWQIADRHLDRKFGAGGESNVYKLNDENLDYLVRNEVSTANFCGGRYIVLQTSGGAHCYFPMRCSKWFCPQCGGAGGYKHEMQVKSVLYRLPVENIALRQFIFTIPKVLWPLFLDRGMLNLYFEVIHKVVERFFGQRKVYENSKGPKYRLEKGAIAYIHIFGGGKYFDPERAKPHVNVHLIEKKAELAGPSSLVLTSKDRLALMVLYHAELMKLCRKLDILTAEEQSVISPPTVRYKIKYTPLEVFHAIRYMTRPLDKGVLDIVLDKWAPQKKYFLICDMKGFRYTRFWGRISDCKYKDYYSYLSDGENLAARTKCSLGYKLVGYMTRKEVEDYLKHNSGSNAIQ